MLIGKKPVDDNPNWIVPLAAAAPFVMSVRDQRAAMMSKATPQPPVDGESVMQGNSRISRYNDTLAYFTGRVERVCKHLYQIAKLLTWAELW